MIPYNTEKNVPGIINVFGKFLSIKDVYNDDFILLSEISGVSINGSNAILRLKSGKDHIVGVIDLKTADKIRDYIVYAINNMDK